MFFLCSSGQKNVPGRRCGFGGSGAPGGGRGWRMKDVEGEQRAVEMEKVVDKEQKDN